MRPETSGPAQPHHSRITRMAPRLLTKPVRILQKMRQGQRMPDALIRSAAVREEALQREATLRIPKVRGERLGLQNHPLGHERSPALQRSSEQLKGFAARLEVRGDG